MPLAVLLGIAVNCSWGLSCLIPHLFLELDPFVLTACRFGTSGVVSLVVLLTASRKELRSFDRIDWAWALAFGFAGVGYYAALAASVQSGGVALTALILGTLPVTIALYGNWCQRELRLRRLLLPLSLILVGLLALNALRFANAPVAARPGLVRSIVLAISALSLWTWYAVKNAQFLKRRPWVGASAWSSIVGISAALSTLVIVPGLAVGGLWSPVSVASLTSSPRVVIALVASCLLLGVVNTWLTTLLWNHVSRTLPISVSSQLLVFSTLSSVLYASFVDRTTPPLFELCCLVVILLGVILGLRKSLGGGRP